MSLERMCFIIKFLLGVWLLSFWALAAAYGQITPSADAYTNTAQASTNFGAKPVLDVQSVAQTAFIRFDLSSIPSGYGSANVAKATLKLYVNAVTTAGSFNVDFVNGSWAENTISADLSPALGTTIVGSIPLTGANVHDYILIDATSAVGAWLDGTQANDGIALVANSPLSASFDSKESTTQSHPPELDIVLTGKGQGTITGVNTPNGSGLTGGGNGGTLTLGLIKTCANGQVLQWNGSSWVCSSAGTGTITGVTAGTGLIGGGTSGNVALNLKSAACAPGQALAGLPFTCLPFATLGANSYSGNQSVAGSLTASGQLAAGGPLTGNVAAGNVEVDALGVNNGGFAPGLTFAGGGETIISNRAGGTNQFGLDFFTNYTPRMSISNAGLVGIGTSAPFSGLSVVVPDGPDGFDGGDFFGQSSSNFFGGLGLNAVGGNGGGNGGDGIHATGGSGPLGSGYAGYFAGNVIVTGNLSAGSKNFKIDHPLDPANKYLVHASVESSEMKNIYDGVVTTDSAGEATVELPAWCEALNTDFRYQLTVLGQFAQAIVAREIQDHQFQIRTSAPNVKVSWQITGVRHDAYAKAHPLIVEEEKEAQLRGYYLHPELYRAPDERQIEWARHPQTMKRLKELRERGQSKAAGRGMQSSDDFPKH